MSSSSRTRISRSTAFEEPSWRTRSASRRRGPARFATTCRPTTGPPRPSSTSRPASSAATWTATAARHWRLRGSSRTGCRAHVPSRCGRSRLDRTRDRGAAPRRRRAGRDRDPRAVGQGDRGRASPTRFAATGLPSTRRSLPRCTRPWTHSSASSNWRFLIAGSLTTSRPRFAPSRRRSTARTPCNSGPICGSKDALRVAQGCRSVRALLPGARHRQAAEERGRRRLCALGAPRLLPTIAGEMPEGPAPGGHGGACCCHGALRCGERVRRAARRLSRSIPTG